MKRSTKFHYLDTLAAIAFFLIVPLTAHLLFSWMGFNPTDDGFILAYSRRLLEGQVPHRDFISIRPIFSALIHTPFVLLGGDHTFYISRYFVWFQLAAINWSLVSIFNRLLNWPFSNLEKVFAALIGFAASSHIFPIMAWHTIDGLFLTSIGLVMSIRQERGSKFVGYLIMSTAYLCKQSFIFMAPLTIVILGDWRSLQYWLATVIPGVGYLAYLGLAGAIPDAIIQLSSQTGLFSVGFNSYYRISVVLGILVGYFSMRLIVGDPRIRLLVERRNLQKYIGLSTLYLLPVFGVSASLVLGRLFNTAFGLFGMVAGALIFFVADCFKERTGYMRVAALALLNAWSVSLSIGYNSPVLASGALLVSLILFAHTNLRASRFFQLSLMFLAVIVLISLGIARQTRIYRDQPAKNLTKELDNILPGGNSIRTNPNTYQFLNNLQQAIDFAQNSSQTYAIIPELAGYWVKSSQANPLPIDWPIEIELNNPQLISRVVDDLESLRGKTAIIVQKVKAAQLADAFFPLPDGVYEVVQYVRTNFTEIHETEFFEIYR